MTVLASFQQTFFGEQQPASSQQQDADLPEPPSLSRRLPPAETSSYVPISPSSGGGYEKQSRPLSPTAVRTFDDLCALENGEALEFIPQSWLEAPEKWWCCRVSRKNRVEFTMALEFNDEKAKTTPATFMLSARRVGNDFFISRYESFANSQGETRVPSGGYCAVLKATVGFTPGAPCPDSTPVKAGERRGFELVPASTWSPSQPFGGGGAQGALSVFAGVTHSWFKQPACGAEIRTVEAQLAPQSDWETASGAMSTNGSVSPSSSPPSPPSPSSPATSSASSISSARPSAPPSGGVYVWDSNQRQQTQKNLRRSSRSLRRGNSSGSGDSSPCSASGSASGSGSGSDGGTMSSESSPEGTAQAVPSSPQRIEKERVSVLSQIPRWNEASQCLVMKFQRQRVRESSSKNFILFNAAEAGRQQQGRRSTVSGTASGTATCGGEVDPSKAVMQFGKVSHGEYSLDFKAPVAPLHAFALALSSFAFKV